jgi:hypothetical protein
MLKLFFDVVLPRLQLENRGGGGSGYTKTFRRSAGLKVMAFLLGLSPQLAKTQLAIETFVNYY